MAFRSSLSIAATLILVATAIIMSSHLVFAEEGSQRPGVFAEAAAAADQTSPMPANSNGHERERRTKLNDYEVCPEVPTLHCKNGSTCTPGIASFGTIHNHLDLQTHEGGYHCKCPKGFIGHECDVEIDDCELQKGTRNSCYNGSKCKSTGNGYYCDCTALNENSPSEGVKFEGLMCQHGSTALCAVSLRGETAPNHQFCTNHGTCVKFVTEGEPHPGCLCKTGYLGDHCELKADPFTMIASKKSETAGLNNSDKVLIGSVVIGVIAILAAGVGTFMWKAEKNKEMAAADSAQVFKNESEEAPGSGDKKVLGEGDLNPDGSATLGSTHSKEEEGTADGDMELLKTPVLSAESEVV